MILQVTLKVGEKKIWSGKTLGSYFEGLVGDGSLISFWMDSWLREDPLRIIYPHLFRLETDKWAVIADRIRVVSGSKILQWKWRKDPTTAAEINELFNLLEEIYDYAWKGGIDKWNWKASGSNRFTVSSARKLLSSYPRPAVEQHMKWKCWTPLKCKIMVWRAIRNRLPTKVELHKRGVSLQNDLCGFCDSDAETSTHIFTGCLFVAEIWNRVEHWCRLNPSIVFDVIDFMKITKNQPLSKQARNILRGIIFTSLWTIWNERNDRIFQGKRRRATEVVESIKMTSYFWFKNRSKMKSVDWYVWCKYPLDLM
ncbi:reverse transcriptase domain, Reverse transcriptase zinc-binding domain protein [Artemisia annua]|uniref:Reverse transcriptase domain, Reverse transcriptase zinc-binding domain protein n=1 Tax=Artemisia annua TaxID=35608 RepID=A0A2U1PQG5_ARTAN|nr:reverse transcriptase domain, Reverse transcriptase zinc-binding domain protein [Artemisia annua]